MLHHLDVHVRDVARAKTLFDAIAPGVGYKLHYADDEFAGYETADGGRPRVGFILDPEHSAGSLRLAFAVDSVESVDQIARIARNNGALAIEGPAYHTEYADDYYAVFFEDPEGNKYEVLRRT